MTTKKSKPNSAPVSNNNWSMHRKVLYFIIALSSFTLVYTASLLYSQQAQTEKNLIIGLLPWHKAQTSTPIDFASPDAVFLQILSSGGLCPEDVECRSLTAIQNNGKLIMDAKVKTTLSDSDLTKLKQAIATADFEAIQSKRFTGTCPIAYDGQVYDYSFFTPSGVQDINSCEVAINFDSGLFKLLQEMLIKYSN